MRSLVATVCLFGCSAFASIVAVDASSGRQPIPSDLYGGVLGDEAHQAELLEAHGIPLPVGDVARAALLGVLGRAGFVDDWPTTPEQNPALTLFTNYDGEGARFGDTSISATATSGGLLAFAAYDSDARVTVVAVNPGAVADDAVVTLGGMGQKGRWRAFTLSADGKVAFVGEGTTYDAVIRHAVPASSAVLIEYRPVGGILPLPAEPLPVFSPALESTEARLPAADEPRGCSSMPGGLMLLALLGLLFRPRR